MNIKHNFIQFTFLFVQFNVKYLKILKFFCYAKPFDSAYKTNSYAFSGNTRPSYAEVNLM